ncbi:MYBBP1A.2 family protein [Megaselia abdita]
MSKKQSHEISTKEFNTLLDVIFVAHKKFNCLEKVVNHVQEIRKKIKLDSVNSYTRVCNLYKVSAIKNSEVQKPAVELLENGTTQINSSDDEEEKPKENGKATKRKNSSKQLKKEKKLKKEARMQISSKGFNESFEFSSNQESVDVDVSDGSAIESEDE